MLSIKRLRARPTAAVLGGIAVLTAVMVLVSEGASARAKDKPTPLTGTIYITAPYGGYKMDADGGNKTPIYGVGEPSFALHNGERWFLTIREVGGAPYPSGYPRSELYAFSETGLAVQLTDAPDLEPNGFYNGAPHPRWAFDSDMEIVDGKVSYLAMRWAGGVVVEGGIYALPVDPENLLAHVPGVPTRLLVPITVFGGEKKYLRASYDWSPDGDFIVYTDQILTELCIVHVPSLSIVPLGEGGYEPRWSPDETKLLCLTSQGDIDTMNVDGSGRITIVPDPPNTGATVWNGGVTWSPTGSHITYFHARWTKPYHGKTDVYRCAADGSGEKNLTKDIGPAHAPRGWRAD